MVPFKIESNLLVKFSLGEFISGLLDFFLFFIQIEIHTYNPRSSPSLAGGNSPPPLSLPRQRGRM
jgi:hypothetical protein